MKTMIFKECYGMYLRDEKTDKRINEIDGLFVEHVGTGESGIVRAVSEYTTREHGGSFTYTVYGIISNYEFYHIRLNESYIIYDSVEEFYNSERDI